MPEKHSSFKAWLVCTVGTLFFFNIFFQMSIANSLGPYLMKDFALNGAQLGHFSAAYFYGNVVFLFVAGLLLDRFSVKKSLLWVSAISALSTWFFVTTQYFDWIILSRFVLGLAGSFAFLTVLKLAIRWFPANQLAFAMGVLITFAMAGGLVAQTPLVWLIHHLGDWRSAVWVDVWVSIAIFMAILVIVRDYPLGSKPEVQPSGQSFITTLRQVVSNRHNWLGGAVVSLLNLPVFVFSSFGALFLESAYGLDAVHAAHVISWLFLGLMAGCPIFGWLSDRYSFSWGKKGFKAQGSRKQLLWVGSLLSMICIVLLLLHVPMSKSTLMVLFTSIGFISGTQVIGYPYIAEHNPGHLAGTAGGLGSTLIMAGGFVNALFGWLLGLSGQAQTIAGVIKYAVHDYQVALLILPVAYAISMLCLLGMVETHAKPQH